MKKVICGVFVLVLAALFSLPAMAEEESPFAGGDGTPDYPYRIETAGQLATVAEAVYLDKYFCPDERY
jgi:hypothetical protein